MGVCVQLATDGTVTQTAQSISECTGYWLATPAESMWSEVFAQWLAIPDPVIAATWFIGPFGFIVTCYLVAYYANLPVSMFNRD